MLPFFNRYYGIKYPLAKLDHIDVPEFGAGAISISSTFSEQSIVSL